MARVRSYRSPGLAAAGCRKYGLLDIVCGSARSISQLGRLVGRNCCERVYICPSLSRLRGGKIYPLRIRLPSSIPVIGRRALASGGLTW
jgi:hypothetical protein